MTNFLIPIYKIYLNIIILLKIFTFCAMISHRIYLILSQKPYILTLGENYDYIFDYEELYW